jgi:bifunctional DNA-binding transcriptional regulator/antitoxin component of YhaV-PrlF toxin-antitoxin module
MEEGYMHAVTTIIDQHGRITLPDSLLEALNIAPDSEVILELTGTGIVITPKRDLPPMTAHIAAMELPVDDWSRMEDEIGCGHSEQ